LFVAAREALATAAIPCVLIGVPGVDSHRLQSLLQAECVNSFASVFFPRSHGNRVASGILPMVAWPPPPQAAVS